MKTENLAVQLRFNRLVLFARLLFLIFFTYELFRVLSLYPELDEPSSMEIARMQVVRFYISALILFLIEYRLFRALWRESLDITFYPDHMQVAHVLTRHTWSLPAERLEGYSIQNCTWDIFGSIGLTSFHRMRLKMVVIHTRFRGVLHLKALHYMGLRQVKMRLEKAGLDLLFLGHKHYRGKGY